MARMLLARSIGARAVDARRRGLDAAAICSALGVALAGCSATQDAPDAAALPPVASAARAAPPYSTFAPRARVATAASPPTTVPQGYKIGSPYVVNGQTYQPAEDPGYDQVGLASWYGEDFHGKSTANGETFDMNLLTAAHKTLPLPSYVTVTNLRNGRTILVRINNRGPFTPGRLVDLSRAAARALGFEGQGTAQVRVRYAGRAPLRPDDSKERQYLAAQVWSRGLRGPLEPAKPALASASSGLTTSSVTTSTTGHSATGHSASSLGKLAAGH